MRTITLTQAIEHAKKRDVLYVVNKTKHDGVYSPLHIEIPSGNGAAEEIIIEGTWAPIEMSMKCKLSNLFEAPRFRRALATNLLVCVDPEWAAEECLKPDVQAELSRVFSGRQINAMIEQEKEKEKPSGRILTILMQDNSDADKLAAIKVASDVLKDVDYEYVIQNSKSESIIKYAMEKLGKA